MDAAKFILPAVLLLLALPQDVRAQPSVLDVKVESISHGSVAIRFQVAGLSGLTLNWVDYGPSHVLGYRTEIARTAAASPYRSIIIGGLAPDSSYYFRVGASSSDGGSKAAFYCASGEGGPGYECDGPDAPPRFHTTAAPGELPVQPIAPQVIDHPFPELTGQTFDVGVDDQRRCLDLQSQLNAAASADTQRNHEVVIPAGATCYGELVLPRKLGPGVVVVRPSTPLDQLPAPGVRIDPSFQPLMATLSVPPTWRSPGLVPRLAVTTPPDYACAAPCTEGWRFVGIEITHPAHGDIAPREARITGVSEWRAGYTLVTLDRSFPVEYAQSVAIGGVSGAPDLNRVWSAIPVSDNSFAVQTAAPSEGASGGYALQAVSLPIASCGPGPRPVCRTALPHGLPQPPPVPIASISKTEHKTPGASWALMSTVELSGTPSGADGLWGAAGVSGGFRLVGSAPDSSCEADCGTATLRPAVQLFSFDSEPRLNGSHIYTILSENEIQLDDIEESSSEADGGALSFDPNPFPRLALFGTNARNIVLDRCWLHGRGFPSRLHSAFSIASDDSALLDSVVSDVNSWRPIAPRGSYDAGVHGYFAAAAIAVGLGDLSGMTIRNNLFENCIGIAVYAEQYRTSSALTPRNVVISGNSFHNDDRYRAGSETSNGRYYAIRHAVEFKRGERILIEGNVFDGNWADWTPLGPAIGLLNRSDGSSVNNRIQDVAIRNNVFRRVATGIQMLSTDDRIEQPSLFTTRVAIDNNLFENVDFYKMRSAPSGVAGFGASANFGGQIVFATGSFEDISITRNTAIDNRGRSPAPFWYQHGRSSGIQVTDNVFTHNHDFSLGGLPLGQHVSQFEGAFSGSAVEAFRHIFTQTPNPDPRSTFARNLILPGVRDSSSPDAYDDPAKGRNFTKADCEAFYAGFPEIECAGSGQAGETANQRIASIFADRSDPRASNGRGADLAPLSSIAKQIGSPVARLLEDGATLEFQTPSSETCFVDVSETPGFAQFQRFQDSGGELHAIPLTGLASGRTYHYRLKCPSDTRFGEIKIPAR